ncbi:MAG: hypothetical protein KDB23_32300, partial [Planctomycetales bacterium]|nr:hypothetical protein [Planctomycetales bacterium]
TWCMNASGAIPLGGSVTDDRWSMIYEPADGSVWFEFAGRTPTTLEVISDAGYFTGGVPDYIQPPFDVFNLHKLFLLRTKGIPANLELGPVLSPGISSADLAQDLSVHGSCNPDCNTRATLIYVPEPVAVTLLLSGLPLLVACSRSGLLLVSGASHFR